MKLLILGGTMFLGRHLVESALRDGHEVTLFNRGRRNPELFPEVEKLRGDRDGGLDALRGRSWDAVIDTCGFVPRVVRASGEVLAPAPPERLVQFIDARDLADWTLRMTESGATGVFNASGPDYDLSWGT